LAQFSELGVPYRLRVQADAEGFPVVQGRYGQIEWYDGQDFAVYSTHPRLFEKLWAIPGVKRHQTGDHEMRAVFPPEALEQVAGVIKARRKRALSPEAARKLGARTAYRVTSGAQKAARAWGKAEIGMQWRAGVRAPPNDVSAVR